MDIVKSLNLNLIRVFLEVYKSGSMTEAARELHITQSGVSQHIVNLEREIHQKLFDRIGRTIVPTAAAKTFFEQCETLFSGLNDALHTLQGDLAEVSGLISVGMPIEYGNSRVVPLLSQFAKAHEQTRYALTMDYASNINRLLLQGALDFAFVDEFEMDPLIQKEVISDEILELCLREDLLPKNHAKHDRKFFESLNYVDYQPKAPVIYGWFQHHYPHRIPTINVRATVMDVEAVTRLIAGGVGAGVIPRYVVEELERRGIKLHTFRGSGRAYHNRISLAYLRGRTQSQAVRKCLEFLKEGLAASK